jgi:hypothetical protein
METDCVIAHQFIRKPVKTVEGTHTHDFWEYLYFIGTNPDDPHDLGDPIIEMAMGEECEKYAITVPTMVKLPPGFPHCPLEFKVIKKPVIFLQVMLVGEYTKTVVKGPELS